MNNCDNWYEMTEQALSTISKLMPQTESSEICPEAFPALHQHSHQSGVVSGPLSSVHVPMQQEAKTSATKSQNSSSGETGQDPPDDGHAPGAEVSGQKAKSGRAPSPVDRSSTEKDVPERQVALGRGVTLSMLLADGLLKAGEDAISFEHQGEKFVADLLEDGKVRWGKEGKVFLCTTSWVVHCKKVTFPHEKLTCSITEQVKYKDKTLDQYKVMWSKKHRPFVNNGDEQADDDAEADQDFAVQDASRMNSQSEDDESDLNWILSCSSPMINYRESIPHAKLGRRTFQGFPNLFVECSTFTKMNKIQPFKLNITKNCLLLLHFHCHLMGSEVVGYLAGKWDSSAQQLLVTQAYPCRCSLTAPKDETDKIEYEIMTNMDKSNLVLVGWYHSHVGCQADPSLRDVETQMEHQFQLKGYESATFQPCVGLVVSPFHMQSPAQLTSDMKIFYVYPPSEQRPLDYGMPLEVEHTISKDDYITDRIICELEKLIKFYSNDPDYLPKKFKKSNLSVYLNRLKNCLSPFCPSGYLSESIVKVFESL